MYVFGLMRGLKRAVRQKLGLGQRIEDAASAAVIHLSGYICYRGVKLAVLGFGNYELKSVRNTVWLT